MDLIKAIQKTIFDTVLAAYSATTNDQSSSPYQNQKVVVGHLWPSQMIDEKEYGNAWSPTNPTGTIAATENISMLVNPIPNIDYWYSQSGRKVEEMYGFMINSAEAVIKNMGLSGKPRMKAAMSLETSELPTSVGSELTLQKTVEATLPDHSTIPAVYMTADAINKKNLEIAHSNAAAAALAYRLAMERTHPKNTSKAKTAKLELQLELEGLKLNTWNDLQNVDLELFISDQPFNTPSSIDRSFYDAKLIFSRATLASVRNPGLAYRPSYTSPENWVDPTAKDNWPLLTIPVADTDQPVNLTITFSRIDITRPWMLASLFELDGWKNSQGPGSLSNGKLDQNKGSFSLLPQSMIVARDIVARSSEGIVYKSTGLQILAYISKLIPYAPPMG